jgi:hypothetical protein
MRIKNISNLARVTQRLSEARVMMPVIVQRSTVTQTELLQLQVKQAKPMLVLNVEQGKVRVRPAREPTQGSRRLALH